MSAWLRPGLELAISVLKKRKSQSAIQNERRRGEPSTDVGRLYWQGVTDAEAWCIRFLQSELDKEPMS